MSDYVTTELTDVVPDIGATGIYTLKTPYDKLIVNSTTADNVLTAVVYTCVAVRKVAELIKFGSDPFALYYTPYNLSASVYEADVAKGMCIVTLRSSAGDFIHVPSTYITSFPKGGGVLYCTYGLAISLGALPSETDLTALKLRMTQAVTETFGVESDVKVLTLSNASLIATDYHERLVAARAAKVSAVETDRVVRIRLEAQVAEQATKIKLLEAALIKASGG